MPRIAFRHATIAERHGDPANESLLFGTLRCDRDAILVEGSGQAGNRAPPVRTVAFSVAIRVCVKPAWTKNVPVTGNGHISRRFADRPGLPGVYAGFMRTANTANPLQMTGKKTAGWAYQRDDEAATLVVALAARQGPNQS